MKTQISLEGKELNTLQSIQKIPIHRKDTSTTINTQAISTKFFTEIYSGKRFMNFWIPSLQGRILFFAKMINTE